MVLKADIEIAAPRILVPVAESEDRGFLLLDTGHLALKVREVGGQIFLLMTVYKDSLYVSCMLVNSR